MYTKRVSLTFSCLSVVIFVIDDKDNDDDVIFTFNKNIINILKYFTVTQKSEKDLLDENDLFYPRLGLWPTYPTFHQAPFSCATIKIYIAFPSSLADE